METEIQGFLFSNGDNFKEDMPFKNVNSCTLHFQYIMGISPLICFNLS